MRIDVNWVTLVKAMFARSIGTNNEYMRLLSSMIEQ
jgi:hypothetical protein